MSHAAARRYPDISDIIARKAEGRRDIAHRTFDEKIAMVEQMRERLEPFKRARKQRQQRKQRKQRKQHHHSPVRSPGP